MNRSVGLGIVVLGLALTGCAPQAGPQTATTVLLEGDTKVKVDEQGHSQVSGAPAPQAPVGEAK